MATSWTRDAEGVVTAIDASEKMVKLARDHMGMLFGHIRFEEKAEYFQSNPL
ncbi:hypothetical protein ACFL5V_11360 [Fibrobacterota bacterium]